MTATTVNDANFSDFALGPPDDGSVALYFSVAIPTTSLDEIDDRYNIASIFAGKTLTYIDLLYNGAGDSGATLDADIVLSEEGVASANGTETIIYNGGTRFQAASSIFVRTAVDNLIADATDSKGVVRFHVVAAATTPAVMPLNGILWIK